MPFVEQSSSCTQIVILHSSFCLLVLVNASFVSSIRWWKLETILGHLLTQRAVNEKATFLMMLKYVWNHVLFWKICSCHKVVQQCSPCEDVKTYPIGSAVWHCKQQLLHSAAGGPSLTFVVWSGWSSHLYLFVSAVVCDLNRVSEGFCRTAIVFKFCVFVLCWSVDLDANAEIVWVWCHVSSS